MTGHVSLRRLVDASERPSPALATEILRQAAAALRPLHEAGRTVPELRPESLVLRRAADGGPEVRLEPSSPASGDDAGALLDSMRHQAPEEFDDRGARGPAGDVYAWGLVAYELLTGVFPVSGESPSSLIAGHLFRPPTPFDEADPEGRVPGELRDLVLRTLAKDPEERPVIAEVTARLSCLRREVPELAPSHLDPGELDQWLGRRRRAVAPEEGDSVEEAKDVSPPLADAPTVTLPPGRLAEPPRAGGEAPDLDGLLEEARSQAREEDFAAARETVRRILRHAPEHEEGRRLLASVEACLKIQVEESKAHETVRLQPGSETATVRLPAEDLEDVVGETERTRPISPELLQRARQEPPPGTVTVPMETVREARRRQEDAQEDADGNADGNAAETSEEPASKSSPPPAWAPPPPPGASPGDSPGSGDAAPEQGTTELPSETGPPARTFDDDGVGHPTSFGKTYAPVEPDELEGEPEKEPSSEMEAEPVPQPPPRPEPSSPSPDGLSDLGFGDREAGYQGSRPRPDRRPRSPSPLDARAGRDGRGVWWLVGSLVAALVVFGVAYLVSSGVDPAELLGAPEEAEPVVPPSETPAPATAVEPGFLVLDAAPWAEIVEIRDATGERQTLRVEHTPARIPLEPGVYSVVLADPVSGERRTLEVETKTGETVSERAVFRRLDPQEYFREVGWNE